MSFHVVLEVTDRKSANVYGTGMGVNKIDEAKRKHFKKC